MSNKTISDPIELVLKEIIKVADEKKAENIRYFSVSEKMWMADYIVIIDIKNRIHGKALCEDIKASISKLIPKLNSDDFYTDVNYSGGGNSDWVLLDLNAIIVHCISDELNEYYKLDELFEKYGPVFHV
jgi:ribosome-associated protein